MTKERFILECGPCYMEYHTLEKAITRAHDEINNGNNNECYIYSLTHHIEAEPRAIHVKEINHAEAQKITG